MFSWVTGNLDSSAGKIVNINYNNVKQLQKANKQFVRMFNASLTIERKHAEQLKQLHLQIKVINQKFRTNMSTIYKRLAYQDFMENMILTALDVQRTIDQLFSHTDRVELNRVEP